MRQVRRIKSLVRHLKSLPQHEVASQSAVHSLESARDEWKKSECQRLWQLLEKWILSLEAMPVIALDFPDIDDLLMADQITEHDCLHACRAENKFRAELFKHHLVVDQNDALCKTSYRLTGQSQAYGNFAGGSSHLENACETA